MKGALLAIDPGTVESGWVMMYSDTKIYASGVLPNAKLVEQVSSWESDLAIEMVASYGMPVGAEVFETVLWTGRFIQAYQWPNEVSLVFRRAVKLHLCNDSRAKDANIRRALLDLFGPQGTKAKPGPTYGVKSHAWAALGVAATVRGITR